MPRALKLALLALALVLPLGCASDPVANDEPSYEDSDVQAAAINPIGPPYAGKTIAIVPFVNKSLSNYQELGNIAPDVLAAFCIEGGWRVVEGVQGAQLGAVGGEAEYGQSSNVRPDTAAKLGKQRGAKYVLVGAVTNFKITRAKAKSGVDVFGIVEVGGSDQLLTYDCQVSSRIIDVETREIVAADSGTAVKQKYQVGGSKTSVIGVKVENSETVEVEADSLGKVLKLAFAKSLNKLHAQAQNRGALGD